MVKKYLIEKELFEDEQCFCNEQTEETRKKWIKENQVIQVVKLSELRTFLEKLHQNSEDKIKEIVESLSSTEVLNDEQLEEVIRFRERINMVKEFKKQLGD